MPVDAAPLKAILLDYGNTIIEFGNRQLATQFEALTAALEATFGTCDSGALEAIRRKQIRFPYENDYRENDLPTITAELVQGLYGREARSDQIKAILKARYDAFLSAVTLPDGAGETLAALSKQYKLALVSNYPCTDAIVASLRQIGIYDLFDAVVVSGELGIVKPHPRIFEETTTRLQVRAEECVFIGDNWLADIQGGKRAGMQAILTEQYAAYDSFEPEPDDAAPDATITHFSELTSILL